MKKLSPLFLLLSALTLASCGGGGNSSESSKQSATPSSESQISTSWEPKPEGKTNDEHHDYASLKVNTPKNALANDFAYGADLSIVAEIEANGGVYYNEEGKEQDIFKLLYNDGVNYARFRLWNNPYSEKLKDENGKPLPYGGGTNDLATDIALAKRAKEAGMKVLIDFHYSDSWADPSKQWLPKAWADALPNELPELIGNFTKESLQAFKDAGITVDSVQIGNETNTAIAEIPTSEGETIAEMVDAGVKGAKSVFPSIQALVHLTNIKSPRGVYRFLDAVKDIDYDMVGLSYYPYWHGSQENLLNIMNTIQDNYGKPCIIAETAYGVTDDPNENCQNQYHSSTFESTGGYITGDQGQATLLADLVSLLSEVKNQGGRGIFYWEPAWLPVAGSTWASKAGQYYNDNGKDATSLAQIEAYTDKSCLPSWCNQGWFSYTGKALPGASAYRHIQEGDRKVEEVAAGLVADEIEVNVNLLDGKVNLPTTLQVKTNLDALRARPVTWDEAKIAKILEDGDGDYEVNGKVDNTFDVVAKVKAETNYIADYSFENQGSGEEVEVKEPWELSKVTGKHVVWVEEKSAGNLDGNKYFHWYNVSDFGFTLQQKITNVKAGNYDLSTYVMAGDTASLYKKFDLWYQIDGQERVTVDMISVLVKGWGAPLARYMQHGLIQNIEIPVSGTDITVGMTVEAVGSAWGHNDLWSFAKHQEILPEEEYVATGALEDGNLAAQTLWAAPSSPWIVGHDESNILSVADNESMKKEEGTSNYFKWWAESAFSFDVHQNIKGLTSGEYAFSFHLLSATKDKYESFVFYYQVEGAEKVTFDLNSETYLLPWTTSDVASTKDVLLEGINIPEGKKVTVGLEVNAKGGAWGRMTDFALTHK